jgi:hypothetical protein
MQGGLARIGVGDHASATLHFPVSCLFGVVEEPYDMSCGASHELHEGVQKKVSRHCGERRRGRQEREQPALTSVSLTLGDAFDSLRSYRLFIIPFILPDWWLML